MARIQIPFQERWAESMLTGYKRCTSRTKRYGEIGDIFEAFGARFQLTTIEQRLLEDVSMNLFRKEGCEMPAEFIDVWKGLHPRKGWNGGQKVWVHHFKKIEEVIDARK